MKIEKKLGTDKSDEDVMGGGMGGMSGGMGSY